MGFEALFLKAVSAMPPTQELCDTSVIALLPAEGLGSCEERTRHWAGVEADGDREFCLFGSQLHVQHLERCLDPRRAWYIPVG